ncbi:MAG: Gfo/Idh/MocA family oxidoreductase [Spirochaetales bacterium]|nr:Gfo/Idh/MocA family oxidoreductase [Spirochaetales bacterium]
MSATTNIAVLGYGMIGRLHSLNYRELPFLYPGAVPIPVLHTVCTSRDESAEAAQREAGFSEARTDLDAVLTNDAIDVVDVSLPNGLHRKVVERALGAGKHVYCEKPLAGTIEDARAIARAAAAADATFGMVFQYRFVPAIVRARQLIDEGRLGRIFTFRAEYLHSGYQNPARPLSWRMKKEEGGSGALGDLGSHVIDLVRYLVGDFASLQGHMETFIPRRPTAADSRETGAVTVDDAAWIRARMKNGAVGTIEASRFATGTLDDLRIAVYGERGAFTFDLMDPSFLYWFDEENRGGAYGGSRGWQRIESVSYYPDAKTPPARAPIGWIRSHAENQYRFLLAVAEGRKPSPGIVDGLKAQLVIDAVERSAADGGRWIEVEEE